MRNRSSLTVEEKTEAILDAAERHFSTHGFEATKLASVAKEAGVAVGTIYLRYPGKEELLAGILDRVAGRFRDAMEQDRVRMKPFPERFVTIIQTILATAAQQEHLARLMSLASFAPTGDAQRLGQILSGIEWQLRDGIERGELRSDIDLSLTASIAYGMVEGAMQEMAHRSSLGPDVVIQQIADAWTRWLAR